MCTCQPHARTRSVSYLRKSTEGDRTHLVDEPKRPGTTDDEHVSKCSCSKPAAHAQARQALLLDPPVVWQRPQLPAPRLPDPSHPARRSWVGTNSRYTRLLQVPPDQYSHSTRGNQWYANWSCHSCMRATWGGHGEVHGVSEKLDSCRLVRSGCRAIKKWRMFSSEQLGQRHVAHWDKWRQRYSTCTGGHMGTHSSAETTNKWLQHNWNGWSLAAEGSG